MKSILQALAFSGIMFFLFSCSASKSTTANTAKWNPKDAKAFTDSCVTKLTNFDVGGGHTFNEGDAKSYCSCLTDKLQSHFISYDDFKAKLNDLGITQDSLPVWSRNCMEGIIKK